MTDLERYLAEEIAEDHVDGIITRREALRRLGLMGVTATAATAMIAAEVEARERGKNTSGGDHGHGGGHGRPDRRKTDWAPAATTPITFPGPNGVVLQAAWAAPAPGTRIKGGVLVIHENRGLTDHIRNVAGRFAANGFAALALDLLSHEGGTAALADDAARMAALAAVSQANPARFDNDMKAAISELGKRLGRHTPLNAIGFCFGGGMVWRLLAAKETRLAAAAPFYGPFPTGGDLRGIRADVLGVYAGNDERVNATRDAAQAALEAARVDYEILTFTEAAHAFFNDTGGFPPTGRFNAAAAEEAWRRVNDWFGDHRKSRD
ncbi:dienelactone hydrolase family protein [Solirubrobacter sp. CPCC 204708]|uniref:Dienelactone hydrolase family protein n=1 Tax=Solirubrobacter deserti TaxID=2282478 RepID=A0ABT4RG21_9ACTN|nr:dienelactone hydrolase family protein [Solirubrobacter deserti]MBE2318196.1 dienelactone hydrolase family protein [Solirubrobacter deserti]MDA0137477.1 dienelactone hydrolase family protein [Solirubrobacter deserti]